MGIFFHSFWRSSSTYIFNKYRHENFGNQWFYEPFCEALSWADRDFLLSHSDKNWNSKHDFMNEVYFKEYLPFLLGKIGIQNYSSKFSYENYFPVGEIEADEKLYLEMLNSSSIEQNKTPVYGFVRSLCRAGQIRKEFSGIHITHYKNPKEILLSFYKRPDFIRNILYLVKYIREGSLPNILGLEIPDYVFDNADLLLKNDEYKFLLAQDESLIKLFFEIWLISTVSGAFFSDYVFNVNTLCSDLDYRKKIQCDLLSLTNCDVNFDDIKINSLGAEHCRYDTYLIYAIEKYIGTKEKISFFKNALERISNFKVLNSIDFIEKIKEDIVLKYLPPNIYCASSQIDIAMKEEIQKSNLFSKELFEEKFKLEQKVYLLEQQLEQEKHQLEQEKQQLKQEKQQVVQEKQQLEQEYNSSVETISGFLNSRSWRITAPLRFTAHIFRKARAKLKQAVVALLLLPASILIFGFKHTLKHIVSLKWKNEFVLEHAGELKQLTVINPSKSTKIVRLCFLAAQYIVVYGVKKFAKNSVGSFRSYGFKNALLNFYRRQGHQFQNNLGNTNIELLKIEDGQYDKLTFPKFDNVLVSIIIPVYNEFDYTYLCLKSIYNNTKGIDYEVILADDCSTDKTVQISEYVDGITVTRSDKNVRFLHNCNNASAYAKGKYILFLNNDTQVQPEWLSSLVQLIEKDATIGLVGSKFVYPDGRLQEAGGILWSDGSAWNFGHGDNPNLPQYNYVREVDYISGACIMLSKQLWDDIGGFDEQFAPAYCEDSDLAFEVRKRGYKVAYQPQSVVVHFEGISNGTDTSTGQKSYQIVNTKKFHDKWKDELLAEHYEKGKNVFLAKDRAKDKKTVLVIDHYIPQYDKDAGSRTVDHYLTILARMGYNVKFLSDNFDYDITYAPRLEQKGIEFLCSNYYKCNLQDWFNVYGAFINLVYTNRPHITEKYIDIIKKCTASKIIYYGMDLHYLRLEREYNISGDKSLLPKISDIKEVEFDIIRKSDVFLTISNDEHSIINSEFGIGKSAIAPIFCYENIKTEPVSFRGKNNIIFVGGFSHTPNVDGIKWFVNDIWKDTKKGCKNAKLVIIGSNPPQEIINLACDDIIVTGFITDEELQEHYDSCRVCVVPLRYGAGVKGKTVEAMKNAVPIVATSIGIEGLLDIDACLHGYDSPTLFSNRVIELYNDEELSMSLALNCREYVRAHFSYEIAESKLEHIFSL